MDRNAMAPAVSRRHRAIMVTQMKTMVQWLLVGDVAEGKAAALRELMAEMVAGTKANEPGALIYEWYLNEEETRLEILERFADNAAAMTHLGLFGKNYASRFTPLFTSVAFHIHGAPGDDLRAALQPFGPAYFAEIGGFAR
jgi:quinol monooxygenase YgiN